VKPEEKQLPIPPEAKTDPASAELLRAWVANNGLHCTMNLGCWGDDEAVVWGILLSDVARHVADALEKDRGLVNADTIGKIRAHFNHELDAPTAETRGDFN
jgi:hypothetical protein